MLISFNTFNLHRYGQINVRSFFVTLFIPIYLQISQDLPSLVENFELMVDQLLALKPKAKNVGKCSQNM